jgi:hypothetical protein
MKQKIVNLGCVLLLVIGSAMSARAGDPSPESVIADAVVARPACLAATIVGSAFFVVALPFAAISKSVDKTANSLVIAPADATFKRPMGDLKSLGL